MPAISPIGPQVRLRDLRKAHGLTIRQLAERIEDQGIKVKADSLSNVELGHKRASDLLLVAWAKALGISPLDVWQPLVDEDESQLDRATA
jgi:transcriptional regulator with XRE-family HTH domain